MSQKAHPSMIEAGPAGSVLMTGPERVPVWFNLMDLDEILLTGDNSVLEDTNFTLSLVGYVPGKWEVEVVFFVYDAEGNEIEDPFGLTWDQATGVIAGHTAPGTGGAIYGIAVQPWQHGGVKTPFTSNVHELMVGGSPVNKCSITAPTTGAVNVLNEFVIQTSAFSADDARVHESTQYQIASSNTFEAASIIYDTNFITDLLSHTTPDRIVPENSTVYIRARHKSTVTGPWSDTITITMVSTYVPAPVLVGTFSQDEGVSFPVTINSSGSVYAVGSIYHYRIEDGMSSDVTNAFTPSLNSNVLTLTAPVVEVDTDYTLYVHVEDPSGDLSPEVNTVLTITNILIVADITVVWDESETDWVVLDGVSVE